jgi:hypothetical protein
MISAFQTKSFVFLLCGVGLLVAACNKKNNTIHSSEDIAIAQSLMGDLQRVAYQYIVFAEFVDGTIGSPLDTSLNYCFDFEAVPDRSADNTEWPRVITVDFGDGCDELDGHLRKGTIKIELNNWWNMDGTQTSITCTDYSVDGNNLQGAMILTRVNNLGAFGMLESAEFSIVASNGSFIDISNDIQREMVKGHASRTIVGNDIWQLTGTMEGVNSAGDGFSASIVTPLVYDNGCPYIKRGTCEVFPERGDSRTLDFGQGECDPYISVNIGGKIFHAESEHF